MKVSEIEQLLRTSLTYIATPDQEAEVFDLFDKLLEVAHFYGDPETYFATMILSDPPCGEIMNDYSKVTRIDGSEVVVPGKLAREAINMLDEED